MFSFAWPWMAVLLVLPFLVRILGGRASVDDAQHAPELFFPGIGRLQKILPQQKSVKPSTRLYLPVLALIWLCLVGAVMRPEIVDEFAQLQTSGYDLMLAVDLSGSMQALDYQKGGEQISRINVVKSVVSNFIGHRQGDRIGLVLFGSNAYLHVPLTLDALSVRNMLANVAVGEAGDQTAIGDAIGLAVYNLRNRPEKSRVIVLLTDGIDNASTIPPLEAAKLAQQYGIRIYTIGVGTKGLVPFPQGFGQTVLTEFDMDEDLLQKIASTTGGSYFRATNTQALQDIYGQINKLEKTKADASTYTVRRPLYRYPLAVALILLLLLELSPMLRMLRHGI
jgi:Ca-activated chloride channel family protein